MSSEHSRPVLVTGAALCQRLLERGDRVIGIENLNSHYDPALKRACLTEVELVVRPADNRSHQGRIPSQLGKVWTTPSADIANTTQT